MKTIAITHMDWALLRKQKLWLLRKKSKHAQGLICMIDHIQDMAVNNGGCTELEVLGPPEDAPVEGAPT